jgi:hypothetical protein
MAGRDLHSLAALSKIYVSSRTRSEHPVSTGDAVRAIRQLLRDQSISDREIADAIAADAIEQKFAIVFEAPPGKDATPERMTG